MNRFVESLEARRLMDAGALDTSFGSNGSVAIDVAAGETLRVADLDITESNQILVTAFGDLGETGGTLHLWRLHADGTRDRAFDRDGWIKLPIPPEIISRNPGDQPPHRPLSALVNTVPALNGGVLVQVGNVLYRFWNSGKPDLHFGEGAGKVTTVYRAHQLHDVAVDAQGRIYLVGDGGAEGISGGIAIRRLHASGAPDLSFGTEGVIRPPGNDQVTSVQGGGLRIRVLADGSVVAGGIVQGTYENPNEFGLDTAAFDLVAVRLTPDGALDTSHGEGGVARRQFISTQSFSLEAANPVITSDGFVFAEMIERPGFTVWNYRIAQLAPTGAAAVNFPTSITRGGLTDVLRDDVYTVVSGANGVHHMGGSAGTDGVVAALPAGFAATHLTSHRDGSVLLAGRMSNDPAERLVLHRVFRDDAPVAQLAGRTLTRDLSNAYYFTAHWRDDDGIDVASLGDDDFTVGFPFGTRRNARLVKTEVTDGGRVVTATYRVRPRDGVWNFADNGRYTIRLERRSVRDTSGHVASQRTLAPFFVAIPATPFNGTPPAVAVAPASRAAGFTASRSPQRSPLDLDALTRRGTDETTGK
jgi:uncharacterized delta-60 repeat protein